MTARTDKQARPCNRRGPLGGAPQVSESRPTGILGTNSTGFTTSPTSRELCASWAEVQCLEGSARSPHPAGLRPSQARRSEPRNSLRTDMKNVPGWSALAR